MNLLKQEVWLPDCILSLVLWDEGKVDDFFFSPQDVIHVVKKRVLGVSMMGDPENDSKAGRIRRFVYLFVCLYLLAYVQKILKYSTIVISHSNGRVNACILLFDIITI